MYYIILYIRILLYCVYIYTFIEVDVDLYLVSSPKSSMALRTVRPPWWEAAAHVRQDLGSSWIVRDSGTPGDMEVSINGSTPIAGWFLLGKIPSRNG